MDGKDNQMSRHLGLDLSPLALRSCLLSQDDGTALTFNPVYAPKGCARSNEYDSAERWDAPLSFRSRSFGEHFEINHVEKTVSYLKPDPSSRGWLEAYKRHVSEEIGAMHDVKIIGTLPDHATPDAKDNLLRGLGSGAMLLWRPVAVALDWLRDHRGPDEALCGKKLVVVDLDGGMPEVTQLELVMHESSAGEIVPVRSQPKRHQILRAGNFSRLCHQLVLGGLEEAEQLIEGQFCADVQRALEGNKASYDAWIRKNAAWSQREVVFAEQMPQRVIDELRPLFRGLASGGECIALCVGWFARRYGESFADAVGDILGCEDVQVMSPDAVCMGAAEFGRRLEAGLPTYYDSLPKYSWWNGWEARWVPLFSQYQRVEPGETYHFPGRGKPDCKLKIGKFNDNVSMYIQVQTEDEDNQVQTEDEDNQYEEDDVYVRRLKIFFSEFLKNDVEVSMSASVCPSEGSAKFTILAAASVFQIGDSRSRSATLHYSEDPDAASYSSVQSVHKHEGYLEPQPVLGRIYDSQENLRMIEAATDATMWRETGASLWANYSERYGAHSLTDLVGYHANPREPTRGMFGTRRIPNARIDAVSSKFAGVVFARHPFNVNDERQRSDAMKCLNHLQPWAPNEYKAFLRKCLHDLWMPMQYKYNFCYAFGFVLGDAAEDLPLLLNYILRMRSVGGDVKAKLWWSVFRMLCWHEEVKVGDVGVDAIEKCISDLISDAPGVPSDDKKFLLLALLYLLRIRETGHKDISEHIRNLAANSLQSGALSNVRFPLTMINNLNGSRPRPGDNLSKYVLRFLLRKDRLEDRELGAAMGGV